MFDRYERHESHYHGPREIHEHRAPTDESVRLLREMEKAARDNVLASYTLDNAVRCRIVETQLDARGDRVEVLAVFDLNGQPYRVPVDVDPIALRCDPASAMRAVCVAMAARIVDMMLERMAKAMVPR